MRLPLLQKAENVVQWANEVVRTLEITLQGIQTKKWTKGDIAQLAVYTVTTLPSADPAGQLIYVSDESGGATPAFSDGTNWRRVADRAVVS